jgi:uncharacterized protein YjbI with pentapeptide repeats
MSNPTTQGHQLVRFEEVTPTNEIVAFFDVQLKPLIAQLGLPIYDGYDGLDELQFVFLTLPSGQTVTLGQYANSPQVGVDLYVDAKLQDIPTVTFETCKYLGIPRQEVIWFHPDWQEEIDRLYAEHGEIEKHQGLSQVEEPTQIKQYEPIDCFYHVLEIYTRENFPEYWALLQHNLGLAYVSRNKGSHQKNLQQSIKCFKHSIEIFSRDEFSEKRHMSLEDLRESQRSLKLLNMSLEDLRESQRSLKLLKKENLIENIINRPLLFRQLKRVDLIRANLHGADLRGANLYGAKLGSVDLSGADLRDANLSGAKLGGGNLSGADLRGANLYGAKLGSVDLSGANLRDADLINTDLSGANLSDATLYGSNLSGTNLSVANVDKTIFGHNPGISGFTRQDLIARGAIFDDSQGDRSESKNLVPR